MIKTATNPQLHLKDAHVPKAATLEWQLAAEALNRLAVDQGGLSPVEREWLLTSLAYADICHEGCGQMTWPYGVEAKPDGGRGKFAYRCTRCDRTWTCGYSTSIVGLFG